MIGFIDEAGMISPECGNIGAEVAVTVFSEHIFVELLAQTGAEPYARTMGCIENNVYAFEHNGRKIAVYKSPIGAPAAVAVAEEVMGLGVKKVVAFGICGGLIKMPEQTVIVPTRAYRDEGTSYHYAPASEYIALKGSDKVLESLTADGIKALAGGTWTTDGFYRETPTRTRQMRDNGCIAVDMESAALQAAADFRGNEFYTFFISADSLAGPEWQPNDILDLKTTTATAVAVRGAIELAKRLSDG